MENYRQEETQMTRNAYELIALAMRYFFAAMMLLIVLRATIAPCYRAPPPLPPRDRCHRHFATILARPTIPKYRSPGRWPCA